MIDKGMGYASINPTMLSILVLALLIRTCTDLCFKASVHAVALHSAQQLSSAATAVIRRPILWVGLGLAACNFWLWCIVLSHFDLSFAYPLFSICYVLIMVAGKLFFDEHIDHYKYIGMGCIGAGSLILILS